MQISLSAGQEGSFREFNPVPVALTFDLYASQCRLVFSVCRCVCFWCDTDSELWCLFSQKSCESNPGSAASVGHHLHALLRESRRRRHRADRFHLFQLFSAVISGEGGPVMTQPDGGRPTQTQGVRSESRCVLSQSCRTSSELNFFGLRISF